MNSMDVIGQCLRCGMALVNGHFCSGTKITPNTPQPTESDNKLAEKLFQICKDVYDMKNGDYRWCHDPIAQALAAQRLETLKEAASICRDYNEMANLKTGEICIAKKLFKNKNGFAYAEAIESLGKKLEPKGHKSNGR